MRGISVRGWIVVATVVPTSVFAHWRPWEHAPPCLVANTENCAPADTSAPEMIWGLGFGLVLPLLWATMRVRGWLALWIGGFPLAFAAQAAMVRLLYGRGRGTAGLVVHTVIETTVLALLYGLVTAFTEAWIERSEQRPEPC